MTHLLEVKNLRKTFRVPAGPLAAGHLTLKAVDGISFNLRAGETLGLVGESGCGKSTTGKTVLRLLEPDSGEVYFDGEDLLSLKTGQMRTRRRDLQMIFQDPYSSLNPRMQVLDIIGEPLKIHGLAKGRALRQEVERLLDTVGLSAAHLDRYPHEFSGGQRQRIGIARALALKPRLIVADEPVSALDLSIQAQVVNLLQDIQQQFELTYLFIAHDLSVIEHISDRVAVMYLGRIVELTPAEELYKAPRHPYSEALLNAVPVPDPHVRRQKRPLAGEIPSPLHPPAGCHFHPRCPYAQEKCRQQAPELTDQGGGHLAACHFSDQVGRYRIAR
ncbi:peptide ABC transporter, ATP-binding protein [Syntrophotalea carbinolica DSM 2380]|uniref:Peptide ABC transporter, ATP-binding protein n=1 Tax=Syntrophotalea carbinolica (strain DSM 2380 / NBRC 103641 / GraBd1) TaxID=338963 RepID=Q3A647_SYNC1|nr:dipeptide ABC transporter ATP-binding protein [Syntrophotalea carbinolica]ABA88160.1 peptide ABC transporter, ATP-binding protein [Syntrophotalea carbinolica DSM 2380]